MEFRVYVLIVAEYMNVSIYEHLLNNLFYGCRSYCNFPIYLSHWSYDSSPIDCKRTKKNPHKLDLRLYLRSTQPMLMNCPNTQLSGE